MTPEPTTLALAILPQTAISVPFPMRMIPERGTHYTASPRRDTRIYR